MSLSRRYAVLGTIALLVLQVAWHGFLLPPAFVSAWISAGLHCLPLLPALVLMALRRPSAIFWAGIAALLYFCHGVTEAWTIPDARWLALLEVFLSVWTIVAGSWPGIAARRAKRHAPAANV